jgi:hypothetical protein
MFHHIIFLIINVLCLLADQALNRVNYY